MTSFDDRHDTWQRRLWLVAWSAVLVALSFVQHPGWTAPDTKFDLTENPGGLLARALSLWDPTAAGGQLQNQAYGYLFPMGPFFWAGDTLGLPGWVIQRLWWAVILLTAFHGARVLLERLDVGTSASRVVAAFAFALAPRMLIGLGAVSSEIWPMAMAPWVLVPLIRVTPGDERLAALRSGLAVLLIGAVNATATIAAILPAALWLLSRSRRTWRLSLWWVGAVGLASLWWVGPLLLLGRYSPAFLDWIESAAVSTAPASVPETLRGTTQWIAGITGARGPLWIAGWEVVTSPVIVAMGLVIVVVALFGLWRAPLPWATFARVLLVVGIVAVTFGRVGPLTGFGAPTAAALLDGALAPFRNAHKFEPLVRVALVLGVAHALPIIHAWLRTVRAPWPRLGYAVVVLAIVAQTAFPALTGVSQRGRYLAVPDYWSEAAEWLADREDGGRPLVLPGSNPASSVWGDPRDEPLQALDAGPWMVRDGVPLGSASATRLLNEIENRVATGYGGAELSRLLRTLGVSKVLLRADLAVGGVSPVVVRRAIVTSNARSAATFGPLVGGSFDASFAPDFGLDRPLRAIEIFEVPDPGRVVPNELLAVSDTVEMSGGPEGAALLTRPDSQFVLASDTGSVSTTAPDVGVVTDTLVRREATFASVRDNYGRVLTAEEDYAAVRRVHDWFPDWISPEAVSDVQTTLVWPDGVVARASSSLTEPGLGQPRDLAAGPESAFDGSGDTAWQSAGVEAEGQWVELTWGDALVPPEQVRVVLDPVDGADVAALIVTTDQGQVRTPVDPPGLTSRPDDARYEVMVTVPEGATRRFRVTVAEVRSGVTARFWDVGAGVLPRAESWLRTPPVQAATSAIHLSVPADRRPACVPMSSGVLACSPDRARAGEQAGDLRRIVTLDESAEFTASGTVVPLASESVDRLLGRLDGVEVDASTTWIPGAAVSPQLAVDGDDRTYWAAAPDDEAPTLTVSWPTPRTVAGIRLSTDDDAAGRRPTEVEISVDEGASVTRTVPRTGLVALPLREARRVEVTVTESTDVSTGTAAQPVAMPVVIGDISLVGDPWPALDDAFDATVGVPCGFGPTVQVAGRGYPTSVTGTRRALIAGEPLDLSVCDEVTAPGATVGMRMIASAEFGPRSLSFEDRRTARPVGPASSGEQSLAAAPVEEVSVEPVRWAETDRVLSIGTAPRSDGLLVVRENANTGWTATMSGRVLEPVTVDGWAQGWVVPAGSTGEVRLEYGPQRLFTAALGIGAVAGVVLLVLCLVGGRIAPVSNAPVVPASSAPGLIGVVGLAAAGGVVAGPVGVVLALAGVAARLFLSPARTAAVMGVLGVALVFVASFDPWPAPAMTNRGGLAQAIAWLLVALSVCGAPGPRSESGRGAPARALENRPLEDVPARGGQHQGHGGGEDDGHPEVSAEQLVPHGRPDPEHDGHVPEEESIADPAEVRQHG
jgi:arabinofuranan 3-O-arabinosyltransferase